MNSTLENDIVRVLNETRDQICANIDAKNINASGRTRASIRVETYQGGVRLVGGGRDTAPVPTLEVGRAGGNVPAGFYYIIREWTREKGLQFASERERGTFAYFVARKIAREGTGRHIKPVDIYSDAARSARSKIVEMLNEGITGTIRAALGGGATVTTGALH